MSLQNVIGQPGALRMLRGAMERGRVATSYIFAGEEGVGKKLTAMNFIKTLKCQSPVDGESCGLCPACIKIDASTHPDVRVLVPEVEQIKVGEIREIEEALSLKPLEPGVKAVVVTEAERMNINAANAFLKTLEEPTPDSLIILVTSMPERLPQTIRSRCARVNFKPLGLAETEEVLRANLPPGGDVAELARLVQGRPGLALREEDPVAERDWFLSSLEALLRREGKHPFKERRDIERWLRMLLVALRDMAVLKITGEEQSGLSADRAGLLVGISGRASLDAVLRAYKKLSPLLRELVFNPNRAVLWNYTGCVLEEAGINVR